MTDQRHAGSRSAFLASKSLTNQRGVPVKERERLLDLLVEHSYEYDPSKPFQLASGAMSDEYVNCKRALALPEAIHALATVIYPEILTSVNAIGGLTMGADPIAISVSLYSSGTSRPFRWFSVRKKAKEHGLRCDIEGAVDTGTTVAIVDDVVTTGGSTIEAIAKCRNAKLVIKQVVVLVDRQQGGLEKIQATVPGIPVKAIFTKAEIHARWEALQGTSGDATRARP
jgi:orotate phosphoribosyltransferase